MQTARKLGLALLTLLAMSGIWASAAPASALFHAGGGGTVPVTGTQVANHVFDFVGTSVTCKKAMFSGDTTGTSETLTLTAEYTECIAFGTAASVSMGSCAFTFNSNGSVSVVNDSGGSCDGNPFTIHIDAGFFGTCKITIGASGNSNLTAVTYENVGGGDVVVRPAVKNISYTQSGTLCGSHVEGQYTSGPFRLEGINGEELFVE